MTHDPAVLVLEDGTTWRGRAYGAVGRTVGEAVFSTGMTGYQETLTDPSYHRQVVVMTAPHVGNTGVNDEDNESAKIWVAGYVVRDPARRASNWRSRRELPDELAGQGVVGISHVDTRAITRHLRERGAMRVGIFSGSALASEGDLLQQVKDAPQMSGAALADEVSTDQAYVVPAHGDKRFTVASVDLGIKSMTPHRMAQRGIESHVLPALATIDDVLATNPDGVSSRTARVTRPPPSRRSSCCARSWSGGSRSSASASATSSSARPSTWAPTSWATATAGSTSR